MGRTIVLSCVLLAACVTPYGPAGVGGFGYRDAMLAPGLFMIEVKVRPRQGYATAHQYAHRRAGELCPGGYVVANGSSTTQTTVVVTQQQVFAANNPVAVITVQCR